MKNYIGIGCSPHEPSVAIVNSKGEVVFAEATERYLQNKRAWHAPPFDLVRIKQLLKKYLEPEAELVAATTWDLHEFGFSPLQYPQVHQDTQTYLMQAVLDGIQRNLSLAPDLLNLQYYALYPQKPPIIYKHYDHHYTHAATGCFSSPFKEAVCAVIDGYGQESSASFYRYQEGKLSAIENSELSKEASLGHFYSRMCRMCGFDSIKGEQWKVMGLAPYGGFDPALYELIEPMIEVDELTLRIASDYEDRFLQLRALGYPKASSIDSADLAFVAQLVFQEKSKAILSNLYEKGFSENLVLIGGTGLNSSWNGLILSETRFKKLHVHSAPGDDGNALGAALLAYFEDNGSFKRDPSFSDPYLGAEMDPWVLENIKNLSGLKNDLPDGENIYEWTAKQLAEGKIVGWVQGRAEFGPRALGNRSILADPRRSDMKDLINSRVKFREGFRPFAPAILDEYGLEYFENYQQSRYMERTLVYRPEVVDKVPAVVHVNGTGRLQSVKREWNAPYYDLIESFFRLTGVPILLNTSFNVMGKPILHSAEDAMAVFFTSGLDILVIGDLVFKK